MVVLVSISINAMAADDCVLPIDGTYWSVASFNNDGAIGSFHPTPWFFTSDGIVSAAGYWLGTWQRIACDKVHIESTHTSGAVDVFDVLFLTSSRFVAVKGNNLYRFGKKIL
jgi:hypothetical protein